ncbi:HNH endonuclease signature motif containing protein [Patescibacteria group bacterium]
METNKKKYSSKRPYIKASIKREVRIEACSKCIVCDQTSALEYHHIDDNRENNTVENIIYLCAVCHKRSHDGDIEKKDLKMYKERARKINEDRERMKMLERELDDLKKEVRSDDGDLGGANDYTSELSDALGCLVDKLPGYSVLAYLLGPISIDDNKQDVREKIRKILKISRVEEDLLIEKMIHMKLMLKIKSFAVLKDIDAVRLFLDKIYENSNLNIGDIT